MTLHSVMGEETGNLYHCLLNFFPRAVNWVPM